MVVLFRWYNGNDKTASAVLNSVHYLSSVTGTKVNVEQVNRVLNDIVDLTDELSRKRYSSNEEAVCALEKAEKETASGKNVVFRIDNMAVLFGWYNGYVKNNKSASEVLRSVHYLSGSMGTTVNVEHVDRVSDDLAELADQLYRKEHSSRGVAAHALEQADRRSVEGSLIDWLRNPCGDLDLCWALLRKMRERVPS